VAVKILSLLPSATEIVYALGLEGALVAVSCDCDYPPDVAMKPVASFSALPSGDDLAAAEIDRLVREHVEQGEPIYRLDRRLIQEIQPDLILAQDLCRVCAVPSGHVTEALETLGCEAEVLSLDPHTLDDVIDGIEQVATAAGRAGAGREVAASLRARVAAVVRAVEGAERVRTATVEWPDPPFTGGHWVPEMVRLAGGADVLGIEGAPSRTCTWDEIEASEPETIVYMPCGYALDEAEVQARDLYDVPAVASTPAARAGRLFAVDASAHFSRPGPRLVDGLEALAWVLHPDLVPAPPEGHVVKVPRPR